MNETLNPLGQQREGMRGHAIREPGSLFIKRCKICSTRTYNRVEPDGAHRCTRCGKINLKANQL